MDARTFRYCLNTSTIRGQKLDLPEIVEVAARAGYQAIEPWVEEVERFVAAGGRLPEIAARIVDLGLTVESAIGFAEWIVDDPARRKAGLEQMKRDMELIAKIGGTRIAAPAMGAVDVAGMSLDAIAERYRAILEIGDAAGVTPQVEVWGFSKTLGKLGEAAYASAMSGHPKACILADVYHLYKGGSPFDGLRTISGGALGVFHMNDYPADPPRAKIGDGDRVWPGDGVAPISKIMRILGEIGFRGPLSVELFSEVYWRMEPLEAASTGLNKTRAVVEAA
jgi:sugar phosphate isomerase/epimerase